MTLEKSTFVICLERKTGCSGFHHKYWREMGRGRGGEARPSSWEIWWWRKKGDQIIAHEAETESRRSFILPCTWGRPVHAWKFKESVREGWIQREENYRSVYMVRETLSRPLPSLRSISYSHENPKQRQMVSKCLLLTTWAPCWEHYRYESIQPEAVLLPLSTMQHLRCKIRSWEIQQRNQNTTYISSFRQIFWKWDERNVTHPSSQYIQMKMPHTGNWACSCLVCGVAVGSWQCNILR